MCAVQSFPWKRQEWSVTVSPTRASVVWKLRDFPKMGNKTGDYLVSQEFEFLNAKWVIQVYPSGYHEKSTGKVALTLVLVSSTVKSQKVDFKFFYRDKFMNEYLTNEFVHKFNKNRPRGTTSCIKREDLLDGELRDLLLAEDTLKICCELRDPDAEELLGAPTETDYSVSYLDDGVNILIQDLQNTYEKEINSDVRLKVGNAVFPAHKFILATRSSIFASILKENPSLEVIELEVEDCSVVKDFLRYMYTGKLGEISSANAPKLFAAANTYQLQQLQEECLMFMKANFSLSNVCDFVKLASKYENAELMARAKTFFNENANLVISSKEWPNFVKECPLLANDLLQCTVKTGCERINECLKSEQKVISEAVATVYDETLFPDVTLKVGGEDLPAHKAILSSRSSVFRGMFYSDMKENRQGFVDIQEMEVQTARQMLRYVYTGKVWGLENESAKCLYVAADRYDLPELKARCQEYLLGTISVDNVCQLALLGDLHSDEKLKSAVRLFLCMNHQRVLQSAIWKEAAAEKPALFWELISSVLLNVALVPKDAE